MNKHFHVLLVIVSMMWLHNVLLAKEKSISDTVDANQLIDILGQDYETQAIQGIKKRFNAEDPKMDFEEATAFWSLYENAGVDFIFADEAIFTNEEAINIGVGNIYLTDVNFYNTTDCKYFQKSHMLPFGVKYGDSYTDVVTKMKAAGAEHKVKAKIGENWWALEREKDKKRYGVSFTFDETVGVTEAKIQYYFGQDHMEWMDE